MTAVPEGVDIPLDEVATALDALTAALDADEDFVGMLHRVCEQIVTVLPGADLAGVTRIHDGAPATVAYTSDAVLPIDLDQYRAGAGPCLHAAAIRDIVSVDIEEARVTWPAFTEAAVAAGVGSYLSAPLVIDEEYSGALNLYGYGVHGFRDIEVGLLDVYVTAVTGTLRATRRYLQARQQSEQLRAALMSRAVIDQAKGILMAARRITADEAFGLLVQQSQRENVKLREIAERIVAAAAR